MDSSYKVLIADDEPITRSIVERILLREGLTALMASSGAEAVQLYREHHPSLVITDWLMPDLTGMEFCKTIRAEQTEHFTYVLFLTGLSDKKNIIEGLDAGANDYLTKPFQPGELLARVRVGLKTVELHNELARKNKVLEMLALTDALTGIPNRRAMEEFVTRELAAAARHGYGLWLAIADLDFFKSVNDTYGHEAGDAVLKAAAEQLKLSLRQSDYIGRFGGEEFLLLLTHANAEQARLALERARGQLAAQPIAWRGQELHVTASFGVAGYNPAAGDDYELLLARADASLYSAKHAGRNCVKLDCATVAVS